MEKTEFNEVRLLYLSRRGKSCGEIAYTRGGENNFNSLESTILFPPQEGCADTYYSCGERQTFGFSKEWWYSQRRVDWINKKAELWAGKLDTKYSGVEIAREGDRNWSIGNAIPKSYNSNNTPENIKENRKKLQKEKRYKNSWKFWWASDLADCRCSKKSYKCAVNDVNRYKIFNNMSQPLFNCSNLPEKASKHAVDADFCIYTLELRNVKNNNRWWYIGLTNDITNRITGHVTKNHLGKELRLWNIEDTEPFNGTRSEARAREQEKSYEVAIEKGTTNIFGGR